MTWKRYAMTPFVLVLCSVAQAQQHRGQPAHNAVAPHHPGGAQPGHPQMHPGMSPEEHMWNQWYHEQMMMNEIMSASRGRRSHQQGSSGRSMPSQTGRDQPAQTRSTARARSTNHEGEKSGAEHPADAKKIAHNQTHLSRKSQPGSAKKTAQRPAASDQGIILLLRTTHTQLEKADHDYAGHRVNAMRHIASAVSDLGSTTPLNSIALVSTGSLAQAQSDRILRDVLVRLRNMESSLATGTNRTEHHRQARTAVAHAIRELETALRVR